MTQRTNCSYGNIGTRCNTIFKMSGLILSGVKVVGVIGAMSKRATRRGDIYPELINKNVFVLKMRQMMGIQH